MRRIGLILAGGRSRRMGVDKATLLLDGVRLVDHVLARLRPQVDMVMIAGPDDHGTGAAVIPDRTDGPAGPAAGLHAASRTLGADAETVLITCPVDTPFLPRDLVTRLCAGPLPAIAQAAGRPQPGFGAWSLASLANVVRDVEPGTGPSLNALARQANARIVSFDDPRAFANLNTPEDLARARSHPG